VLDDVFNGHNEAIIGQLTEAVRSESTHHRGYIAYVGTEPASVGRLYTHPDSCFAGLYGGGTRPSFRGRGLYRAVVAARARDAIADGARYLIVDALPSSRPILERLGFEWLTDTWPCDWRAWSEPIPA
jgi:GNAT superfamily N-acetyltransferase